MQPGPRLIPALACWAAIGAAASFLPTIQGAWWGAGGVLAAALLWDALRLRRPPRIHAVRDHGAALSLGEWHEVSLRLENRDDRALSLTVFDHHPPGCEVVGMPQQITLPAGRLAELDCRLRPTRRGEARFGGTAIRSAGPLGLLLRQDELGEATTTRVYPSFRRVASQAFAVGQRAGQIGVHLRRRRGHGLEFHQLRDYREGDSPRQIDWKAVSRRQQMISREYRDEQNQRVVFVLDCGRRMRARDGELGLFDRAIDAMLLLSFIALRQGDAVGLVTFGGHERWLPPQRGRRAMQTVLDAVYDLDTTTAPSDYAEACHRLATRQPRRALVVLLSNLRDDDAGDLSGLIAPLRKRHVLLLASLRDPALRVAREAAVVDLDGAIRAAALDEYELRRRESRGLLRGRGVRVLDVEPVELPRALVAQYMEIKRMGLL